MSDDEETWQYQGRNLWHDFDEDINDIVDDAFQSGQPTVQYSVGGQSYTIDFGQMKQQCDSDPRRTRKVRSSKQSNMRGSNEPTWQHKGRTFWQDFPEHISDVVEDAFLEGDPSVQYTLRGEIYEIDFSRLKQRAVEDPSRARDVRRSTGSQPRTSPIPKATSGSTSIDNNWPGYWDVGVPGIGCTRVRCTAAVIAKMQKLFDHTYSSMWTRDRQSRSGRARTSVGPGGVPAGYRVTAVWRLQAPDRWKTYVERRTAVMGICQSSSGFANCAQWRVKSSQVELEATKMEDRCSECYMFHGAPEAAIMAIADSGFDVSKARPDGLLGGNKIYLAENSTKADEYTGVDAAAHHLLVCRAVLGIYRYTEDRNPNVPALDNDLRCGFQSIWAHRRHTTGLNEIAIANPHQVYAEYLVTYVRR